MLQLMWVNSWTFLFFRWQKLVKFPTRDNYFFHIKNVGPEYETFHTIQSLKTKEYLHCSNDGEVFMKEVQTPADGKPEDRQTWFRYMQRSQTQEQRNVISTGSCGACWVKNWGELAPVSHSKIHARKNMAAACCHSSLGKTNLYYCTLVWTLGLK